jgi:hypothetical protein
MPYAKAMFVSLFVTVMRAGLAVIYNPKVPFLEWKLNPTVTI